MHLPALLGQVKTATAAFAQPQAQAFFKLAHLLGNHRLALPKADLRGGEAVATHDLGKDPQQLEVKIA